MTLVVTGGAGFIGSRFLKYYREKYPERRLVCIDKLTYAGNPRALEPFLADPGFRFLQADICDREAVEALFEAERPWAVINFAAESHVDRSISDPSVFLQTNVLGTQVLLDACRDFGGVRFHQVSTDEVYGDLPLDRPDLKFTEASPLRPGSPYSASKAAADLLALAYRHTYALPVTVSRCSNNYGPFQHPEKLIPHMIGCALKGEELPVYGTGANVRDWIHVSDHCRALDAILERGTEGELYNVGGNCETDNLTLVKTLCGILGIPETRIAFVADRKGHDRRYAVDAGKLQTTLGWQAEIPFERGLKDTVEWYLRHREMWEQTEA